MSTVEIQTCRLYVCTQTDIMENADHENIEPRDVDDGTDEKAPAATAQVTRNEFLQYAHDFTLHYCI